MKALLAALLLTTSFIRAQIDFNPVPPEVWELDTNLSSSEKSYNKIEQIHVIEVPLEENYIFENESEIAKTLYYHFVFRLGYRAPIANLLIMPSGQIFQFTEGDLDAQIPHEKTKGIIVVGIVTSPTAAYEDKKSIVVDTIADLCSMFGLSQQDVFASDWLQELKDSPVVTFIPTENIPFSQFVDGVKNSLKGKIEKLSYSIELVNTEVSATANAGEEATIEVEFKNTGEVPIYKGDPSSLMLGTVAEKDHTSEFYSESWASLSRGGTVADARVATGEEGIIQLACKAPLLPGEHTEKFGVITSNGTLVQKTQIIVTINVKDTGQKVLEVTETGTGYLNVRDSPSGYSNVIDTVPVGNKYLFTDSSEGYYKIIIDDQTGGWVTGRYVNVLTD